MSDLKLRTLRAGTIELKKQYIVEELDEDDNAVSVVIPPGIYEYRVLDINGWRPRQLKSDMLNRWVDVCDKIDELETRLESMNKLESVLVAHEEYHKFTLLPEPTELKEFLKDEDVDNISLYLAQIIQCNALVDIVGFYGIIAWKNNAIVSLDDDTYSENMKVIGYAWRNTSKAKQVLDLLVCE